MDCLDYLFDDSIELENRLKEEIEKYNLKYS